MTKYRSTIPLAGHPLYAEKDYPDDDTTAALVEKRILIPAAVPPYDNVFGDVDDYTDEFGDLPVDAPTSDEPRTEVPSDTLPVDEPAPKK